ncbi:MAG TPA: alpha/beta hydrolase-fold protein [Thermoanaerobaculia bacterium]
MIRLVIALLLIGGCAHAPAGEDVRRAAEFERGSFRAANGVTLPYRLLRPAGKGPFPLLVVFHGSGAIGTDNEAQLGPLAKSLAARRGQYPAYVLIPQFPDRSANYTGAGAARRSHGTELLTAALELVRDVARREQPSRTFAIGWSMGGSAVWNALVAQPRMFDAVAIVAGVPNPDALAQLGATRVLLVHGDADEENPFAAAWAIHERAPRIELWRYPGLAHEFPKELLETPRLAEWLFRRP